MALADPPTSTQPESHPAWDIAKLFPDQGDLSDVDFLRATRHSRRLAELNDGNIEVLPMPTTEHQVIVQFLSNLLLFFITPRKLGRVLFAPLRVRLRTGKFREPDVVFMLAEHADRIKNEFWEGADLVMEVISEDDPDRDLITKRSEYAAAGIMEYWIVDPRSRAITVLRLEGDRYAVHGEFKTASQATSALLPGFIASVDAVFAAAEGIT